MGPETADAADRIRSVRTNLQDSVGVFQQGHLSSERLTTWRFSVVDRESKRKSFAYLATLKLYWQ